MKTDSLLFSTQVQDRFIRQYCWTTFTAIVNFISCLQFIVTLSISANSHSDLKSNHSIIMSKLLFLGRLYYHYASQSRLGDQSRHDVSNPGFGLGRHNCLLPNAEPLHLPVPLADMVATLITAKIVFKLLECSGSFNCKNSRLLFCAGLTNFLLSLEQKSGDKGFLSNLSPDSCSIESKKLEIASCPL